jgi:BirA family transcriptional regulator, biotin operon repressor / biotin---[acetyl-CoA-carboxylase] ligase
MSRSISSSPAVDRLNAAQIRSGLGEQALIGREIIVRERTTSTNDDILQFGKAGASAGIVVFAEHQTAGRGQHGNIWESAAHKGLWLSILLRPNVALAESPRVTKWAIGIIAATIEARCRCKTIIKPPNDVFVANRKIAGVLVEMRAQENAPHFAIVGIGLNVNHQPHDFSPAVRGRAGSLAMLLHRSLDRSELAIELLRNFDESYRAAEL